MLRQLDSQLTASKDSHGSWIPKTVVSTGLGREEWDCGVGLAEQELGPRERRVEALSGRGEDQRHGGLGPDQGKRVSMKSSLVRLG